MIQFHANRRSAFCVSDDRLTTGSVGLETVFRFSEDWEAAPARVAVFRGSGRSVDVLLTGDCCSVPPEVLTEAGDVLSIGVYGTDGNGSLVIPTVYDEAGTIERGAEPSGLEPDEQTQPLIDQLVTAAQAARSRADYALLFAQTLNAGDDIPLDVAWERGGMSSDGADNNTQTYCCRTVGRIGSSAGLAIRAADGFRYTYQVQEIVMAGESLSVKSGSNFYYIHSYFREELREESLKLLDQIFADVTWEE